MTFIKFEVHQDSWITREADSDDQWDNGSTDGSVYIESAKIVQEHEYDTLGIEGDVKVGDTVYLVWAKYGTGDSFGSYGGNYELLAVYRDIEDAKESETYYSGVNDYSVPWNGYFDFLQGVYIDSFTLEV